MFGITLESNKPKAKPLPLGKTSPRRDELAAEYDTLASTIGLDTRTGNTSLLGRWLADNDYPVFHLGEVISYMDRIARRDNPKKSGWLWVQLRSSDRVNFQWGKNPERLLRFGSEHGRVQIHSNYYHPGAIQCSGPYSHTVPLHALRKIAAIEKGLGAGKVAFMVSDYSTHEGYKVDPFLLAVSRDGGAKHVIDFWDEPGFGLEQMLKG